MNVENVPYSKMIPPSKEGTATNGGYIFQTTIKTYLKKEWLVQAFQVWTSTKFTESGNSVYRYCRLRTPTFPNFPWFFSNNFLNNTFTKKMFKQKFYSTKIWTYLLIRLFLSGFGRELGRAEISYVWKFRQHTSNFKKSAKFTFKSNCFA